MAGSILNAIAFTPATSNTSTTYTVPSTTAGSVICVVAGSNLTTTKTVKSVGGSSSNTWVKQFTDTSSNDIWTCLNAGAGLTSIIYSTNVTAYPWIMYFEIAGANTTGNVFAVTSNSGSSAAFSSVQLTPGTSSVALGFAFETNDATSTGTPGTGWSAITGTGFSSGAAANPTNGDTWYAEIRNVPAGTFSANGTWSISQAGWAAYAIAFDQAAVTTTNQLRVILGMC